MSGMVLVEEQPTEGRVIALQAGITIGREGCDVILDDPEVSRRHAVIGDYEGTPTIEDLGSMNGTFLNGVKIEVTTMLAPGVKVQLGKTLFRVEPAGQ
jgi:DNA segregation ATPase FtsK/SpoIIIE, S-DNA-T family